MSEWFLMPAKVMLFVLSDSFLVPAGIVLLFTMWIALLARFILKIKKQGWKNVGAEDARFDAWRSSPSYCSFDDDNKFSRSMFTDPLYRNLPGNVYNWDR